MGKNGKALAIRSKPNELKVEFYPSKEESMNIMKDIEEIHQLVAKIILTGIKKGRPVKKESEDEYGA